MNPRRSCALRWLSFAAVAVPLALVAAFTTVHGQGFRGVPDPPRPPFGGPERTRPPFGGFDGPRGPRGFDPTPRSPDPFERPPTGITIYEWRCSRCNGLVATGAVKPLVSKCPHCGASFTSSGGFFSAPITPSTPRPSGSSLFTGVTTLLVILAGALLLVGATVGIVLLVVFANKKGKPKLKKRKHRPPREGAYPEARPI